MSADHYTDLKPMIAKAFAGHRMRSGPGYSWRLATLGTGFHSFRVTWAPGVVLVSGDVGDATYRVWPSFANVWDAAELVHRAEYDYLTGKSRVEKRYDRDATVEHILELADDYLNEQEDDRYWKRLFKEFNWRGTLKLDIELHRKVVAKRFRDESDMSAEQIYHMFGDSELPCYSWPAETRWTYEAVKLWAAELLCQEPRWHRAWRKLSAEVRRLRRIRRSELHIRPQLYAPRGVTWFNGSRHWLRTAASDGRVIWRSVHPLKVFGHDLSRFGLWCEGGSSWPEDGRERFDPIETGAKA